MKNRPRFKRVPAALMAALALVGCATSAVVGPTAPVAPPPGRPNGDPGPHSDAVPALILPAMPITAADQPARRTIQASEPASGAAKAFTPVAPVADPAVDARILIVATSRDEVELGAITQALDAMGTPYDIWAARERPGQLTSAQLATGTHGRYQGVILTTGNPAYDNGGTWTSALTDAEWQALWGYEAAFKVRQATWYTWPTPEYGFGPSTPRDTTTAGLDAKLTPAGAKVFANLNPQAPITIRYAYTYLAKPADASTTPLLTDADGNALVAVHQSTDGRENLAMTFDSNQWMLHAQLLAYGVVGWVTRGLFLGERKTYAGAQVDDFFYPTTIFGSEADYRMDANDLLATAAWQRAKRTDALTAGLKLNLAFNGEGANGSISPDPLTPTARLLGGEFNWISHTFTHLDLDTATEAQAKAEVTRNTTLAKQLKLPGYGPETLVTGGVSGLNNAAAMRGLYAGGVRFVVSDTSRPGEDNPSPNNGIYNALQPAILEIPRRPTNLFYNVSTPQEWTAEYNQLYRTYWGHDVDYAALLEIESDTLCTYMLRGEMDPWMFHQANLRAYDGRHSLLSDLLDKAIAKYAARMAMPVLSPSMLELGKAMAGRMAYDRAGVTATIVPGKSITLTAKAAALVPVTGLDGSSSTAYAGVPVAHVSLAAGQTLTFPLKK
ncbi:MAG: hypothetical protein JWM80_3444 [Cyanobacteria bacterium RYN_339]|nr:hypothetical protein [Cyanobacteria bacterium RYN_339]